ncbi:MAG: RNA methyltransferase [Planctomycetota bacterium]|nr:MAG: RNA methyltransferase [Planctomycetota bacterium]
MLTPAAKLRRLLGQWQRSEELASAGWLQVEGAEAVRWLLRSDCEIHGLWAKESTLTSLRPEIEALEPTRIFSGSRQWLCDLLGFPFDRGVVALARRPETIGSAELLQQLASEPAWGLVIADHIHDPANLGTMIRSARCLGARAMIFSPGCADPWSRRALRAGVGHPLLLSLALSQDVVADLHTIITLGGATIAAHRGPCAQPICRSDSFPKRWALVLGNEDRGIQPNVLAACSHQRYIPLREDCDSLNVAAAAAILLAHCRDGAQPLQSPP